MTELEINKAVAEKLGLGFKFNPIGYITVSGGDFDPCNNARQAWGIMMKYNICVVKNMYEDYYDAYADLNITEYYTEYKHHRYNKKPLVSAMLCFLEIDK